MLFAHIGENSRLDEVAAIAGAMPAGHQSRAILLSRVDVGHHFFKLDVIHLRALFRLRIERISDRAGFGARGAALDKLVVRLLFDE